MTIISFLLLLSTLANGLNSPTHSDSSHAMYISVVEIKQDLESEKGVIMVKVFANDLEDAIFNFVQKRIDLSEGICKPNAVVINNYFDSHVGITINDEPLSFSLSSCEINDISIWLTFRFEPKESWQTVEVSADHLMELFSTQSNIINISYKGEKRMFRLTKGASQKLVSF